MKKLRGVSKVVDKALRHSLDAFENFDLRWSSDAELSVCSVCALPVKPCLSDPLYACREKILGGTVLSTLLIRGHRLAVGDVTRCALCGKPMSARTLKNNALREVCPGCQAKLARVQHGTNQKG